LPAACLLAACASSPRVGEGPAAAGAGAPPRQERAYLLDPAAGYPLVADRSREEEVSAAYRRLMEGGDDAGARATADRLLAADPGFHPASVLAAEAEFAAGRLGAAAERLRPVTGELPAYTAAQLLLGRVAETLGYLPEAYGAYLAASGDSELAGSRARALRPRTLEILARRVHDDLARGRVEEAAAELARLESWGADEDATLEAAQGVAAARGDAAAELAAVSRLAARYPTRRDLAEHRAALELDAGDVRKALEVLQGLAARYPGDPRLAEELEVAKFHWRLDLLPEDTRGVVAEPELTRGDFASLLYWLVPDVRYAQAASPRIAGDILDNPRREEIAKVANLGLMQVDPTLHRFAPDDPLTRLDALAACVAVLARGERPPACLGGPGARASAAAICAAAARCRLIDDGAACLPQAAVAGREAADLIRRTLALE
jgi:hypothetical protein